MVVKMGGGKHQIGILLDECALPREPNDNLPHILVIAKGKKVGYDDDKRSIKGDLRFIRERDNLKLHFTICAIPGKPKHAKVMGDLRIIVEKVRAALPKGFSESIEEVEIQLVS